MAVSSVYNVGGPDIQIKRRSNESSDVLSPEINLEIHHDDDHEEAVIINSIFILFCFSIYLRLVLDYKRI